MVQRGDKYMKLQCPHCKKIFEIKSNVPRKKPKAKPKPKSRWDEAADMLFGD
jgi:phage FluMu protein Com